MENRNFQLFQRRVMSLLSHKLSILHNTWYWVSVSIQGLYDIIEKDEFPEILRVPVPHTKRKTERYRPHLRLSRLEAIELIYNVAETKIYQTQLVCLVAQADQFILQLFRQVFKFNPESLVNLLEADEESTISLSSIITANSGHDLLSLVAKRKIDLIDEMDARQKVACFWLLIKINFDVCADIGHQTFDRWFEIKATADAFLAGDGVATEKYMSASGSLARVKLNEQLVVDYDYFKYSIMILKMLMVKCQRAAFQLFDDSKFETIEKDEDEL